MIKEILKDQPPTTHKDPRQFGSFDGLDNRRQVMELFARMSQGVSESTGNSRRGGFLKALIDVRGSALAQKLVVTPCSTVEAYQLFVQLTSIPAFGVDVTEAAELLEAVVRRMGRKVTA